MLMLATWGAACAGPAPIAPADREAADHAAASTAGDLHVTQSAADEEAKIEISIAPAQVIPFVGLRIPKLRIEGDDLMFARITFWRDRDRDGQPGEDEVFETLESRGREPIILSNQRLALRPHLMGEVYVEDSQGRSRRHRWHLRTGRTAQ